MADSKSSSVIPGALAGSASAKLAAYLRAMAAQGKAEKARAVLRAAARSGAGVLPGCGPITVVDVDAALADFDRAASCAGASQASAAESSPARAPAEASACAAGDGSTDVVMAEGAPAATSKAAQKWKVCCEAPWHQASRADSTRLGTLPVGRVVTEMSVPRAVEGWLAILPRGWVQRDRLELATGQDLVARAPAASSKSEAAPPVAGALESAGASAAARAAASPQKRKHDDMEVDSDDATDQQTFLSRPSKRVRPGQGPAGDVYVLDALNVLRHSNDERPSYTLEWSQLAAAGKYYRDKGKKVYAFLRKTRQWDPQDVSVQKLAEDLGPEFVVRCPPGADDDGFMIAFARDMEEDPSAGIASGSSAGRPCCVRIVTNDNFRDHHSQADYHWVQEHTVKYAFAGGRFVPQARDK